MIRIKTVSFIFALLLLVDLVTCQTSNTAWPMYQHDAQHTGRSPYNAHEEPTLKWTFAANHWIFSAPAIGVDSTIYFGSLDSNLYAVNFDGTLKWSFLTGGDIISTAAIGSDGTIFVGSGDNKLYAINLDGTLRWEFDANRWINSSPVIDENGTIFVGCADSSLYAINQDGTLQWRFSTGGRVDSSPAIGIDGTIYIGSENNLLSAVNPDGTTKWVSDTGPILYSSPAIGSDGTIYIGALDKKVYALNSDGTLKWTFTTGYYIDSTPAIGLDGTIYVGSLDGKLYAINPDGSLKWEFYTGDIVSCAPVIDSDGTILVGSGIMLVGPSYFYAINPDGTLKWKFKSGSNMGKSSAIGSDGTIYFGGGDSLYAIGSRFSPSINTIKDIPYDQGKQVRIIWSKSTLDVNLSEQPITNYVIWRRVDNLELRKASNTSSSLITNNFNEIPYNVTEIIPGTLFRFDTNELWDYIESIPALQFDQYSFIAPTLYDSTETASAWSVFFISAHTKDQSIWYASTPDSGYSIDNLSPPAPSGLSTLINDSGIELNWKSNREADFNYYSLYRDIQPNFELNEPLTNLVDTSFVDTLVESGNTYYYRLTVSDFSGNESFPSSEIEVYYQTTGLNNDKKVPSEYSLVQNYPNPFNPSTTIKYSLPSNEFVSIKIFNLLGREISTLVNEEKIAGFYEVKFDGSNLASGVYIYQIKAGDYSSNKKFVLMK